MRAVAYVIGIPHSRWISTRRRDDLVQCCRVCRASAKSRRNVVAHDVKTGTVTVDGTNLYYEIRGSGPTLLFIPGAEGDAEEYLRVAELLTGQFTTLCYDRRGYSRSPRPADFAGTTVREQVDDAAALLKALGLAPAMVWGNSSGAIIGLGLALRYPELVTKAMLHEPPLAAGMSDPAAVTAMLIQATANGKVGFLRLLMSDALYEGLSAGYRSRLEADDTWISYEFGNFETYRPSDDELANVERPVRIMYGAETLPFFGEVAHWLGARTGSQVDVLPGNHALHYALPDVAAQAITDFAAAD
jgi:pimeloyl-ACP methyl ester carboxylesterase